MCWPHRVGVSVCHLAFIVDFTPYFHFRCVARATFDRNLIHSADACFLVNANELKASIGLPRYITCRYVIINCYKSNAE